MEFLRQGRQYGAYHVEVDTREWQTAPHAVALWPEGVKQQQRAGQAKGEEDLRVAAWTACHGAMAQRDDAAVARGSVRLRGERHDRGAVARQGDVAEAHCLIDGGARWIQVRYSWDHQRHVQTTYQVDHTSICGGSPAGG